MRICTLQEAFINDVILLLLPLLVTALLFFLAGYFLNKRKSKNIMTNDLEKELKNCKQKYNELFISTSGGKIEDEDKVNKKKSKIINKPETEKTNTQIENSITTIFGNQYTLNDLKLIEGIGPKIASILNNKNINSWKELANADPEKIKEWLFEVGGATYKIHDPSTWSKQALLASEGNFEELKKLQDELKRGRP